MEPSLKWNKIIFAAKIILFLLFRDASKLLWFPITNKSSDFSINFGCVTGEMRSWSRDYREYSCPFSTLGAFSALTLLVVRQEVHPACKNWVVRYRRGYLSGARYYWFAYGPADATATHHLLLQYDPEWFTFLVTAYPGCPVKQAVQRM